MLVLSGFVCVSSRQARSLRWSPYFSACGSDDGQGESSEPTRNATTTEADVTVNSLLSESHDPSSPGAKYLDQTLSSASDISLRGVTDESLIADGLEYCRAGSAGIPDEWEGGESIANPHEGDLIEETSDMLRLTGAAEEAADRHLCDLV